MLEKVLRESVFKTYIINQQIKNKQKTITTFQVNHHFQRQENLDPSPIIRMIFLVPQQHLFPPLKILFLLLKKILFE